MAESEIISEKSCGAVVYTRKNGKIKYVIIQAKSGIYGFPKGHIEPGETQRETALREILEETGLSVNLIDGFKAEDCYCYVDNGKERRKQVIYFLATYSDQAPVVQETELTSIHLMELETAMKALQFESTRKILTQAHSFLAETQSI